ncbi:MAG: MFS transporter [Rhodobacteraceae bacterium]|nr:MFS transporter [Paracoccaceae bacterium]
MTHTDFSTDAGAHKRAKFNVKVLVLAQAILGSQMPMIFTIGGLAGQTLAPNPCYATLPISLIVLGSMFAANPLSMIMQRYGRRVGFFVGAFGGAMGGAVGAYGLYLHSFEVFLLGSFLTGIYMSAQGFYRFAAADTASEAFRPKAISYVMAGGLASALIGPICAMVSYALMNLVMTSTPLAVVGCGFEQNTAADVVSAHVLAMFVPSFFTGHLIARFGTAKIVAAGLFILGCAGAVALQGVNVENFFLALILLGVGWNFGFIGATTMLASAHNPEEKGIVQGMNDFFVFGGVTVASLSSGGLMNCSGGSPVEGWTAVNIAMIPFLTLAGGALIWLAMQKRRA